MNNQTQQVDLPCGHLGMPGDCAICERMQALADEVEDARDALSDALDAAMAVLTARDIAHVIDAALGDRLNVSPWLPNP